MMSNGDRKTLVAFAVFAVGFTLFCFWLVFSYTDAGHRAEARINDVIPRWLTIANFLVLPCVTAIAAGAHSSGFALCSFDADAILGLDPGSCLSQVSLGIMRRARGIRAGSLLDHP
jgi:hypothetical protein